MNVSVTKILNIRGSLIEKASLGENSWFRCGGNADLLFKPADLEDLLSFLNQYEKAKPLMVLGSMANCIIRDGGIRGCVIHLGKAFSDIKVDGTKITVGAGALNGSLASAAVKSGIGGLEFLSGIPGTIGGAICMNAGAYGAEVKDVLFEASAVGREGHVKTFKPEDLKMSYRYCQLPDEYIFINAVFKGKIEETFTHIKETLSHV